MRSGRGTDGGLERCDRFFCRKKKEGGSLILLGKTPWINWAYPTLLSPDPNEILVYVSRRLSLRSFGAIPGCVRGEAETARDQEPYHSLNDSQVTQDLPDRRPKAGSGYQKKAGTISGHRVNVTWTQKRRAANENDAYGPLGLRLLHAAPHPLTDIIFVHGLRGVSIKTRRKGDNPPLFWPQQWLLMEPGLNNVNIYSFNYDSDWGSSNPNILNVHDFGRELFEEMESSPFLRQKPNVRKYAGHLPIHSFYETLPMSLGISSSPVVEKGSAILGMSSIIIGLYLQTYDRARIWVQNESARYMNANHQEICKFGSPEDYNYLSLRNSLVSVTQDSLQDVLASNERDSRVHLEENRKYLGVSIISDEYYESLEGSCGWPQKRYDLRERRDEPEELDIDQNSNYTPWIYWVTAGPGAGKSVLASHVRAQLEDFQVSHAFHHIHARNKSSQSLARCLRLMAYQMASSNVLSARWLRSLAPMALH
ncbi:hypothetical protein SUNI508_05940 [Seiridium unicorne]|uniref:Nephrocystin 3-like N-terminal domain-containing protein n=1 Tax=Seiridium unicorne TaxID=138068 RepID=A0ABR2V3A2_9PEZI